MVEVKMGGIQFEPDLKHLQKKSILFTELNHMVEGKTLRNAPDERVRFVSYGGRHVAEAFMALILGVRLGVQTDAQS